MKKFWIIIALLLATTVYLIVRGRGADQHLLNQPSMALVSSDTAMPVETKPAETEIAAHAQLTINSATDTAVKSAKPKSTGNDAKALAKELESSYEQRAADDQQAAEEAMEGDFEGDGTTSAEHKGFAVDRRKDGSMLLDERYVVRGSGTEKDPYRITWELLVSASESYAPDQDMYEMPPRIEFLNGKHVRITGFLFTAMLRDETTELLMMRNMWDGCCVGVPPSSYDAIEVTLRKPLRIKGMGLLESGVLSGVLKVDPYVKDNWLLGLYVMQDGVIDFGDL